MVFSITMFSTVIRISSSSLWVRWSADNLPSSTACTIMTRLRFIITTRLEQRTGFEPVVLVICNHLHWAALPPLRCYTETH